MSSGLKPYNFTISDQSPLFQYQPSRDGPIDSSWNVTYSGRPDSSWVAETIGVGTSSHRTTFAGASVQLDWIGTAVFLYGEASGGGYTIKLDGTQSNPATNVPTLLYGQSSLSYGSHSLVLQVVQGEVTISSADITVGMGQMDSTIQNNTIATNSVPLPNNSFVLSGSWVAQSDFAGTLVPRIGTMSQGGISFPLTSTIAFYVVGSVNFNHGLFTVTLTPPSDIGSPKVSQYNGSSRWFGMDTTLYLETGMDRSRTYQVQIMSDTPAMWFDISRIVMFDAQPSPTSSGPSATTSAAGSSAGTSNKSHSLGTGVITGIAIGGFLVLLMCVLILVCIQRRRERRKSNDDITYAGPMAREPSLSGISYDWSPTSLVPAVPAWNSGVLPPPMPSDVDSMAYPRNSLSSIPVDAWNTSPNHPPSAMPSRSSQPTITTTSSASPPLGSAAASSHLTDEQSNLVQSLLRHDVPVNTVAGVIEGLLRGQEQSTGGAIPSNINTSDRQPVADTLPAYDFKS